MFDDKQKVLEKIGTEKIVSVIRTNSETEAFKLVELLRAGGIKIFEITMTVPNAVRLIENLTKLFGDDILIGAGTILDRKQAENCLDSGSRFIVSPIFKKEIIEICHAKEVAVFPAGLTPNEILSAAESGADGIKIFPANSMGGANYLKSLKAVFPNIKLMPTGGVNLETINDFLKAGAFAVGIGSELADVKLLREKRETEITARARDFIEKLRAA